jgi:hypothetical protein
MVLPGLKNIIYLIPNEAVKHIIKDMKITLEEKASIHIDLGGYWCPPNYSIGSKQSFAPW